MRYSYGGEKLYQKTPDETRVYLGGVEFVDGTPELLHIPNGRVLLGGTQGLQLEYYLTDHLGNIVTLFSDRNEDGIIQIEEETAVSGEAPEVLQRNFYYLFGLRIEAPPLQSIETPENDYLYNGKELVSDLDIDWHFYGARMYDAVAGRFKGLDSVARPSNE